MEDEIQPLNVLIVGGGIGGLTAAIALRRQGHQVQVRSFVEAEPANGSFLTSSFRSSSSHISQVR